MGLEQDKYPQNYRFYYKMRLFVIVENYLK
jgi:hypothetical protein